MKQPVSLDGEAASPSVGRDIQVRKLYSVAEHENALAEMLIAILTLGYPELGTYTAV